MTQNIHEIPENFRIKRIHLHEGNSTAQDRQRVTGGILQHNITPDYLTISRLLNDNFEEVSKGIAICRGNDTPTRKKGREIADGRALKAYFDGLK